MKIIERYLTRVQRAILPHLADGKTQAEAARLVSLQLGERVRQQDVTLMKRHNPYFLYLVQNARKKLGMWGNMSARHKRAALRLMELQDITQTECAKRLGFAPSQFSRWKAADRDWGVQIDAAKSAWAWAKTQSITGNDEDFESEEGTAYTADSCDLSGVSLEHGEEGNDG